jgi:hypothetical protein
MTMLVNKRRIVAAKNRVGSPEAKRFNTDFWRKLSAGEKLVAAWEMTGEVAFFKGSKNGGESRLQRSVEHVERRGR